MTGLNVQAVTEQLGTPASGEEAAQPTGSLARVRGLRIPPVWWALGVLLLTSAVLTPASLRTESLSAILPFAAFMGIAAMGEAVVVLSGGFDLSVGPVITMVGIVLLEVSGGRDGALLPAVAAALAAAAGVGLVNGLLVAKLKVNALVATLAVGSLVTGGTLWYRGGLQAESTVPPSLARWGGDKLFGSPYLSYPLVSAIVVMALLTFLLRRTTAGRSFIAVGANGRAAWVAGLPVARLVIAGYAVAGALYGVTGVVLAAFIRNPGEDLGGPYVLAPLVAVVIGGVSLAGGSGSITGVVAGTLFLIQLEQVLRVKGYSSGTQSILLGLVILAAMGGRSAAVRRALPRLTRVVPTPNFRGDQS